MNCDQRADCFDEEATTIVDRRTYTTSSTDADGNTTQTTHYELTWRRANGSRQAHDVSWSFYDKAREGDPARLRLWRDEVVGVEMMGREAWFLPGSGRTLAAWMFLALFGLGVLLWGLLFGWWDGFFMLAFRAFCWMFMGILPIAFGAGISAFGLDSGSELAVLAGVTLLFSGIAGWMLFSTFKERW
ncbi:hypothetical protein [Actinomadura terrae]|uniref:hypothetical protein n=1 Tax=Actinomadura terrae TaxID=604353 RepID=UPI001FA77765|nr:hypothetical protein [Actinomadura terrae]